MRHCRSAGQEPRLARSAGRADGADAGAACRSAGPDSAGLAVFGEPAADDPRRKLQPVLGRPAVRLVAACASSFRARRCSSEASRSSANGNHAVLTTHAEPHAVNAVARGERADHSRALPLAAPSTCTRTSVHPRDIAERYGFTQLRGTHVVGHTRMATESAVTPAHAHPFTAGRGLLPRAQRLAVESAPRPPQARAARHRVRDRQRHRGRLPLLRVAHARGRRPRQRPGTRLRASSTASTRS